MGEWGFDAEVKGNRSRVEREKEECREERHRERGFPALSERRYSDSADTLFSLPLATWSSGRATPTSPPSTRTALQIGLTASELSVDLVFSCFICLFVHLYLCFSMFDLLPYLIVLQKK